MTDPKPIAGLLAAYREHDAALSAHVKRVVADDRAHDGAETRALRRAYLATLGELLNEGAEFSTMLRDGRLGEEVKRLPGTSACRIYSPDGSCEVRIYIRGDARHPLVPEVAEIAAFWGCTPDEDRECKRVVEWGQ